MKHSIVTRISLVAVLVGIVVGSAAFAQADARGQQSHKARKGFLNTTVATDVGGVTLEPGEYEIKEVKSKTGPYLRFTKVSVNYEAAEGLPVYESEVVAEVKCMAEPVQSKPERTEFLLASDTGRPIGLKIGGSDVEYRF